MKPEKCLVWGLIISSAKARPFFILYSTSCELGVSSVWLVGRVISLCFFECRAAWIFPWPQVVYLHVLICYMSEYLIETLFFALSFSFHSSLFSITLGISTKFLLSYSVIIWLFSFVSSPPGEQSLVIWCPIFWNIFTYFVYILDCFRQEDKSGLCYSVLAIVEVKPLNFG